MQIAAKDLGNFFILMKDNGKRREFRPKIAGRMQKIAEKMLILTEGHRKNANFSKRPKDQGEKMQISVKRL